MDAAGANPLAEASCVGRTGSETRAEDRAGRPAFALVTAAESVPPSTSGAGRCAAPIRSAAGDSAPVSRWLANSTRRKAWIASNRADGPDRGSSWSTGLPPRGRRNAGNGTSQLRHLPRAAVPAFDAKTVSQVRARGESWGSACIAVLDINGRHRTYRAPTATEFDASQRCGLRSSSCLSSRTAHQPLPDEHGHRSQFRSLRSLVYGIDTWRGLFNDRQLWSSAPSAGSVRDSTRRDAAEGEDLELGAQRSPPTSALWSTGSPTTTRRSPPGTTDARRSGTLSRSKPFAWRGTTSEIDPFGESPGNWDGATDWIELAIRHCSACQRSPPPSSAATPRSSRSTTASSMRSSSTRPTTTRSSTATCRTSSTSGSSAASVTSIPSCLRHALTPKRQEIIESRGGQEIPRVHLARRVRARLQSARCGR